LSQNHNIQKQEKIPSVMGFISRLTLRQAKTINITMESWEWIFNLEERLISALAGSKKLVNFSFCFRDGLKTEFLLNPNQSYPDIKLAEWLSKLTGMRGIPNVTFTGDLPTVYTEPLARILMGPRRIRRSAWPRLRAINGDGSSVELPDTPATMPAPLPSHLQLPPQLQLQPPLQLQPQTQPQ
jgi:hypothetical protein